MELLNNWINGVNDILWSYILIIMLLGCAVWFTIKSRFVQFRMIGEMIRLLGDSAGKGEKGEKHISSFQAFAVSLASRVGTGNLAGVATAVAIGGPGSVFWMWLIALLGSSSAFVESTLAQLYKEKDSVDSCVYRGGPAYYATKAFGKRWIGVIISFLLVITFGFAFNATQSFIISNSFQASFNLPTWITGIVLTIIFGITIFGGVKRITKMSEVIVPVMADPATLNHT